MTYGEADARYGIEVIDLRTACASQSIPSILRSVVRGEVPTTVWWLGNVPSSAPDELTDLARQIVFDSSTWADFSQEAAATLRTAERARTADLVDLSWHRLQPLLSAICRAVSDHPTARVKDVQSVEIAHDSAHRGCAQLLAGWARHRLAAGGAQVTIVDEHDAGTQSGAFVSVIVRTDEWSSTVALFEDCVEWEIAGGQRISRRIVHEHEADAIVDELCTLARDESFTQALRHAV
jgi:glucose-6-phosphate dehydrogenase assembly protein OpcA